MQLSFTTLALLTISGLAVAQTDANGIPSCAVDAVNSATQSVCGCITDYTCACENQTKIQGLSTSAVIASCGADVAVQQVLPAAEALCAKPPADVSCASTEPSSSAAAAPTTTEPAPVVSTTSAPESSAPVVESSSETPTTTVAPTTAPASPTTLPGGVVGSTGLPGPSTVPFTGAGAQATAAAGMVFAGAMAMLAAF